jgi:ParB/RepB/Spo0J family partition protein
MTTAVAAGPRVIKTGDVALVDIVATTNVRKKFAADSLQELAQSIKRNGVIQPITLRPNPNADAAEHYELVAGERRYRAAMLAELAEIPARVLELDDQQALLYQIEENINRKDLTPIEEAFGFKTLVSSRTVEEIASMTGKPESYVYRTMRLAELPTTITDAIEDGRLTPAHGHQILRLPDNLREEAINRALTPDYEDKLPSARDLRRTIDRQLGADLERAPFSKTKPLAGEVACSGCPYNSGNQGKLFDGAEKGTCSNAPCFEKKIAAHYEAVKVRLEKKHPGVSVVLHDDSIWQGARIGQVVVDGQLEEKTKLKKEAVIVIGTAHNQGVWVGYPIKKEAVQKQQAQPKADPQDNFIALAVNEAILKALAAGAKKLTKKHLIDLVTDAIDRGNAETGIIEKVVGCGLETNNMTEAELNQALVLLSMLDWDGAVDPERIEGVGVKVGEVTKKATAAAKAEWAKQQAADKKGTPAK